MEEGIYDSVWPHITTVLIPCLLLLLFVMDHCALVGGVGGNVFRCFYSNAIDRPSACAINTNIDWLAEWFVSRPIHSSATKYDECDNETTTNNTRKRNNWLFIFNCCFGLVHPKLSTNLLHLNPSFIVDCTGGSQIFTFNFCLISFSSTSWIFFHIIYFSVIPR